MSIATVVPEVIIQEIDEIESAHQITLRTASKILAKHLNGDPKIFYEILTFDHHSFHPYFERGTDPNDEHVYESDIYQFIDLAISKGYLASPRLHDEPYDYDGYASLDIDYATDNHPCILLELDLDEFGQFGKLSPTKAIALGDEMIRLANIAIANKATIEELYPPARIVEPVSDHHFRTLIAALISS